MITHHIIFCSGFLQNERKTNGITDLLEAVDNIDEKHFFTHYMRWRDNAGAVVNKIREMSPDVKPVISIVAYSWGAGSAHRRLCKRFARVGIPVSHSILIDPVYRSRVMPRWLPVNPLSLTSWPTIKISNSKMVFGWRQSNNRPAGHNLQVECPGELTSYEKLDSTHGQIQFHPKVQTSAFWFLHDAIKASKTI